MEGPTCGILEAGRGWTGGLSTVSEAAEERVWMRLTGQNRDGATERTEFDEPGTTITLRCVMFHMCSRYPYLRGRYFGGFFLGLHHECQRSEIHDDPSLLQLAMEPLEFRRHREIRA